MKQPENKPGSDRKIQHLITKEISVIESLLGNKKKQEKRQNNSALLIKGIYIKSDKLLKIRFTFSNSDFVAVRQSLSNVNK